MKILALSDPHGMLPDVLPCDLLLIAGDICPIENHSLGYQAQWLDTEFRRWLMRVPAGRVVGVAGNHDFIFEREPASVPRGLRWDYLQCGSVRVDGLSIWGSPWQPWFFDWAFNAPRESGEDFLDRIYDGIPEGTDIIVSHGPPRGYGDRTVRGNLTGSEALLRHIQRVRPKLCVFGHIHEGRGQWQLEFGTLANVCMLDVHYSPAHGAMSFEV